MDIPNIALEVVEQYFILLGNVRLECSGDSYPTMDSDRLWKVVQKFNWKGIQPYLKWLREQAKHNFETTTEYSFHENILPMLEDLDWENVIRTKLPEFRSTQNKSNGI